VVAECVAQQIVSRRRRLPADDLSPELKPGTVSLGDSSGPPRKSAPDPPHVLSRRSTADPFHHGSTQTPSASTPPPNDGPSRVNGDLNAQSEGVGGFEPESNNGSPSSGSSPAWQNINDHHPDPSPRASSSHLAQFRGNEIEMIAIPSTLLDRPSHTLGDGGAEIPETPQLCRGHAPQAADGLRALEWVPETPQHPDVGSPAEGSQQRSDVSVGE